MSEPQDWRLFGQEKYLFGASLVRSDYARSRVVDSPWEDDHCEFCGHEFMKDNFPDVLHEGYATQNGLHWICADCFNDFAPMFCWTVSQHPASKTP
ncbi:MAG TPA: hypothetical protein VM754_04415 [Actinomycetota bacterium]|nr:hypothetical protein [Actinomycetota bacterium]